MARLTSGNSDVPIGTPSSPAISIGAIRRQSASRQTSLIVARWPTTEHAEASWAATRGSSACSHIGRPESAVPNPVNPLTKPPTNAPASTSAIVLQSPSREAIGAVTVLDLFLKVPTLNTIFPGRTQPAPETGQVGGGRNGTANRKVARKPLQEGFAMTRLSLLSNPLLLGFEEIERLIDRAGKGGEGYPPYNIERISTSKQANGSPAVDTLRITLAVAGFKRDQLQITIEDNQLVVRGRQEDDKARQYIYRGIAARQFVRTFVLAEGIEVKAAELSDGMLSIDLVRREPERTVRTVQIKSGV